MRTTERKAALAAYRERKTAAGIYAVRCTQSGQAWVGGAPNIETIQNRIWFALRQGDSTNSLMQAAWSKAGADAFVFEVLETFDGETAQYPQGAALKQRLSDWQAKLGAEAA